MPALIAPPRREAGWRAMLAIGRVAIDVAVVRDPRSSRYRLEQARLACATGASFTEATASVTAAVASLVPSAIV